MADNFQLVRLESVRPVNLGALELPIIFVGRDGERFQFHLAIEDAQTLIDLAGAYLRAARISARLAPADRPHISPNTPQAQSR